MSGDRLAQIEERCEFFGQHSGWVTLPSRDVLALVEIAKAARDVADHSWSSLDESMGTMIALRSALAEAVDGGGAK